MERELMQDGRKHLYSAHISNLPCSVTSDELKELFSAAGDVVEVYLSPRMRSDSRFTFAFIRYKTDTEVLQACELLNNVKIENCKITVTLSTHTQDRMRGKPVKSNDSSSKSIVRQPMPRLERNRFTVLASDERLIHQKLKSSLSCLNANPEYTQMLGIESTEDIKDFMKDLKDVLVKTSSIPFGVGVDSINFRTEKVTKSHLEDIIIRYHDSSNHEVPFKDIDLDISDNRLLSDTEWSKFSPSLPEQASSSN